MVGEWADPGEFHQGNIINIYNVSIDTEDISPTEAPIKNL